MPRLRQAYTPHPVVDQSPAHLRAYIDGNDAVSGRPFMEEVLDGLTGALNDADLQGLSFERTTPRLVEPDTQDNLHRLFEANRWTDMLPIVLPTEARVEATRRTARFAWAAVAVMAAGVTAAVGWTAHHLTQARTESQHLQQQLSATSATVSDVSQERDTLRAELASARENAARTEGKLEAATQASARLEADLTAARDEAEKLKTPAPATQPSTLLERVTRLWWE